MKNIIINCDTFKEVTEIKAMLEKEKFDWELKLVMTSTLENDIQGSFSPMLQWQRINSICWINLLTPYYLSNG